MANQNPTTWENPGNMKEPLAWTLQNKLLAAAGGAITLLLLAVGGLVLAGNNSLCSQIAEVKQQHKEEAKTSNAILLRLVEDVAVLKANQTARLERERTRGIQ